MKTISIIAPDAVPLPLKAGVLASLPEKEKEIFISKYLDANPAGIRAWKFAEILSEKFDVTLLVPDVNLPEKGKDVIDYSGIKFNIDCYNYRVSSWNWTQELDRKLKKANFVIIQSNSGSGIQNCSILPGTVNLIVDGWNVLPLELSGNLLTHSKISRKVFWQKAMGQYTDLVRRANCLLIANDKQHYFYEGFFYGIDKLNCGAFQFSPVLKVPYGVDSFNPDLTKKKKSDALRLLWYGSIAPWENPECLIKDLAGYDNISVDFLNVRNIRQPKAYNTYFKTFFDRIPDISNMQVIERETVSPQEIIENYDYGINLSRNWLYESYVHKPRLFEMLSWKLPIITNKADSVYNEFEFLRNYIEPVHTLDIKSEVLQIMSKNQVNNICDDSYEQLQNVLSWKNVLLPVIDYINNF
jgi:hypothetical protein